MGMWRNGSALDSKSKGCEFKSRRPQQQLYRPQQLLFYHVKQMHVKQNQNKRSNNIEQYKYKSILDTYMDKI